jgi:hypothetical protein
MPVKKRISKQREWRITQEAVEAFKAGDFHALHRALGLKPWEPSPLPLRTEILGVDQSTSHPLYNELTWPKIQEIQRELLAAVGRPVKKLNVNG